jgi:hypothetical protein
VTARPGPAGPGPGPDNPLGPFTGPGPGWETEVGGPGFGEVRGGGGGGRWPEEDEDTPAGWPAGTAATQASGMAVVAAAIIGTESYGHEQFYGGFGRSAGAGKRRRRRRRRRLWRPY